MTYLEKIIFSNSPEVEFRPECCQHPPPLKNKLRQLFLGGTDPSFFQIFVNGHHLLNFTQFLVYVYFICTSITVSYFENSSYIELYSHKNIFFKQKNFLHVWLTKKLNMLINFSPHKKNSLFQHSARFNILEFNISAYVKEIYFSRESLF